MIKTGKQQTRSIYKEYNDFYRIAGGLALVIFGVWIGSLIFSDGYTSNIYTEVLSIFAIVLVLDQINQWRDRENLKRRLWNEVHSPAYQIAVTALEYLRRENWLGINPFENANLERVCWNGAFIGHLSFRNANLRNGRLIGVTNAPILDAEQGSETYNFVDFYDAKMESAKLDNCILASCNFGNAQLWESSFEGAYLELSFFNDVMAVNANFQRTILEYANMTNSNFIDCDFRYSNATCADFSRSQLENANMKNSILIGANFKQTTLRHANLSGADLTYANLENVNWFNANGGNPTILPDGLIWTANTDMEKFTNPQHPDFNSTLEKINVIRSEAGIDALK